MRSGFLFAASLTTLIGVTSLVLSEGADEKPKYTIKEVMIKAHKEGLLKKVLGGKATKDQKEELVALYTALTQNMPPKGEEAAWKKSSEAVLTAVKALVKDGDAENIAKVKKATNCKACHDAFKG